MLFTLLSGSLAAALSSSTLPSVSAPAFVWGSSNYIAEAAPGQVSRVAYEGVAASQLIDLLSAVTSESSEANIYLNNSALAAQRPEIVLIYTGHKLHLDDLSSGKTAEAVKPLQIALQQAPSSLSLPYVAHMGSSSFSSRLLAAAKAQNLTPQVVGCQNVDQTSAPATTDMLAGLEQALQPDAAAQGTQLIIVCSSPDASVESELAQLGQMQDAVRQAGKAFVMGYIVDPLQEAAGTMRSLLQTMLPEHIGGLDLPGHPAAGLGAAPEGSLCDGKCRAQVYVLEAIILAVIIISAVSTGVCMMNILNTPSRFEAPKEASRHAD